MNPLYYARFSRLMEFLAFLPDGRAVQELHDFDKVLTSGRCCQFEVQLVLKEGEVPRSRLGDESAAGPRVGRCGWLKTDGFSQDAGDAVFSG